MAQLDAIGCVCVWRWLCSYADQSGEHSEEYETEEQLQVRVLTAALEFVPLHGWSMEAIAAGAEVCVCVCVCVFVCLLVHHM